MTGWLPDAAVEWGGRPVARTVVDAWPRRRAVLSGTVVAAAVREETRRRRPVGMAAGGVALDTWVSDGTGTIVVRWVGRRSVPGIRVGALLTVEGTVAELEGRRTLLNPLYRFDPDHSSTSW